MKSDNLFLRDAGVLLEDGRADLWLRLERCETLAGKNNVDVQITLDHRYFLEEHDRYPGRLKDHLSRFRNTLIHLHTPFSRPYGRNDYTYGVVSVLKQLVAECGNIRGICVHPDYTEDFSVFKPLAVGDRYLGVEVLGSGSRCGNRLAEMSVLLQQHDFLSFVPDTAHILEMAEEGELGLSTYLQTFGDRVREIHVSRPENLYAPAIMGKRFTTSHSFLTLKNDDAIISCLAAWNPGKDLNIVIEGVVPPGEYGETCLRNETAHLRERLCEA